MAKKTQGKQGFHLVIHAAREEGLPANTLAKIFQRLARYGLLSSQRGPGGGYALARPPSQISLADILRAVQDIAPGARQCLLAKHRCGEGKFCALHDILLKADREVVESMESLSLADLAKGVKS